jgi:hypothetical protein
MKGFKMDRKEIIVIFQVGILALLIYSFQIIFEFVEYLLGFTGFIEYLLLIINPIIATVIIALFYGFFLNGPIPKIIRAYSVMLYASIQFIVSNIKNGFYIESIRGTIFTGEFYFSMFYSIIYFFVIYFILNLCFEIVSSVMFGKGKNQLKNQENQEITHDFKTVEFKTNDLPSLEPHYKKTNDLNSKKMSKVSVASLKKKRISKTKSGRKKSSGKKSLKKVPKTLSVKKKVIRKNNKVKKPALKNKKTKNKFSKKTNLTNKKI